MFHDSFESIPHHGYVSKSALPMAKFDSSSSSPGQVPVETSVFSTTTRPKGNITLLPWLIFLSSLSVISYGFHLASINGLLGLESSIWNKASFLYPLVIAGSCILNLIQYTFLGSGGERIAKMMGGSLVTPDNRPSRKLLQVVEEVYHMSEMSGGTGQGDIPKTYIIPTEEPNAFAAGTMGGEGSVVAVTTGLLIRLNREELKAVVAHEIGHLRNKDTTKAVQVAAMIAALGCILEVGLRMVLEGGGSNRNNDKDDDDDEQDSSLSLGIIFCMTGALSYSIASLLRLASSRSAEYDADQFAKTLGLGGALASALEKIDNESYERDAQSLGKASGAFAHSYISNPPTRENSLINLFGLLRTHPATSERVARLVSNTTPKNDAPNSN